MKSHLYLRRRASGDQLMPARLATDVTLAVSGKQGVAVLNVPTTHKEEARRVTLPACTGGLRWLENIRLQPTAGEATEP